MEDVLYALGQIVSMPYSATNIAIVLVALIGAFGLRSERLDGCAVPLVIAWSCLYYLAYQLLEYALTYSALLAQASYEATLVLNLAATISFALLFVGGRISERFALTVSCLFPIMCARSLVTSAFRLFEGAVVQLGDAETLVFYLLTYAIQLLMMLLFITCPLRPARAVPAGTRHLLLCIPAGIAAITQVQIVIETRSGITVTDDSFAFQLFAIVAMLGSYYLTSLLTRAYEELMEERQLNQRLELSLDHVQRSGAIVEEVRRDKHELKNMFLYMQALFNDRHFDELGDYLNEQMPRHFDGLSEFHTGNNTLDYLLTQKASEARQAGAKVYSEVLVPTELGISDRDLCGLLGNLLDNAIDASRREAEAGHEAEVRLSMQTVRGFLLIQIKNRSSEDVLAKNPGLKTTKADADRHGIGIKVITSLVRAHNGSFATAMEGGYFVATALLAL